MKPRVLIGLLPLLLVHCAGDRPPPAEDTAPLNPAADFAPRRGLARIKRRAVPDECFRDKALMSKWIDGNR